MKLRDGLIVALIATVPAITNSLRAHAMTNRGEIEVALTMASIDFQAKNFRKCQSTLKNILNADKTNVAALELLALTQRQLQNDSGAARTYETLIQVGTPAKMPAYNFELATIRYKQKKIRQARRHFDVAAKANFNPGTSHFFLGVIEFNSKSYKTARYHLASALTHSDARPMAPITRYYLASTYAQLGRTDAAIRNYYEAEQSVVESERTSRTGIDPMFTGIRKNALKELQSLDKDQRFAVLTMLNQWDSNVQTNPSEVDNPTAQSSQRSAKAVFSAAAGYSTSPTRTLQITPSLNFFTNYNYHHLARDFNFASYTPTLFIVYKPFSRLSFGVKADGTFSMKNNLDAEQSRRELKYRPFSLTGNIGPVLKYELNPRIILGLESYYRPKKFYLDPATGPTRRTGSGVFGKVSAEYVSPVWWLNPLGYVSYEWDNPVGKDFRMRAWGLGLSNAIPLTEKLTLTTTLDFTTTDYFESEPRREDDFFTMRLLGSYALNAKWSALADFGWTSNNSTISTTFKYSRIVVSGGASYSF